MSLDHNPEKKSKTPKVITISQMNRMIKNQLEGEFSNVWLQGEISNFKPHSSGHHYFSLKDSGAQISAVMFRGANSKLKFQPKVGMEVVVRGKITVYEPRGNYQIICDKMEPLGAGALQQAFEQLKTKLRDEGLFASEKKKALPVLPKHVALVTSPTGAAVKDMLNVLKRRSKSIRITVVPCLVQGESAPESIVQALVKANQISDVDAIIVGRGGGSIEDLWGFNNEMVARTIFSCSKPVISAVGHEIDFTIADFVADMRAPTPSAAAELVVENSGNLQASVDAQIVRLKNAMLNRFKSMKQQLNTFESKLVSPRKYLQDVSLRVDDLLNRAEQLLLAKVDRSKLKINVLSKSLVSPQQLVDQKKSHLSLTNEKLIQKMNNTIKKCKYDLNTASVKLDSISPLKVVQRGYSLVTHDDKVLKDAKNIKVNDQLKIQLAKGYLIAKVTQKEE